MHYFFFFFFFFCGIKIFICIAKKNTPGKGCTFNERLEFNEPTEIVKGNRD
jgi:hypothetical protein